MNRSWKWVEKFSLVLVLVSMLASCLLVSGAMAAAGDTPPHTKNLTDNQDGTYTISLDVVGESEKKPNNVNVIVIMDTSGSMTQQRMNAAKNAVNSLANALYAYNTESEPDTVEMALVRFATSSSTAQSPTNNATTFRNAVNGLPNSGDGGTNWESALQRANGINFNDDDQTFAIFVSDGNPTFRTTQNGWNDWSQTYQQWGTGRETDQNIQRCYTTAVDDAQALAAKVTPANFFTIGAFGSVDRMEQLTNDAGSNASTNYYSAQNTAALNQAIADILAKIEMAGFADVDVTDGTTNQVTTSSGDIAGLLEVDTDSFKYYRTGGEYGTMAPWDNAPEATFTNGKVDWDLSEAGVLENGVRYTVTFDCYPSQYTYDLIAQLKNGDITYDSLDSEIKKYIVDNGDGNYSVRTNTNASISWDDTRDEEGRQTAGYTNPDPVKTDSSTLTASKEWEGGSPDVDSLQISVMIDDESDPFHEATLSKPDWSTSSFISPGIIKGNKVLKGAEGHDFTFAELGDEQYHWELESPTVHPMLINGVLTMLIKVDDDHPAAGTTYTINGETYYVDSEAAGLTATNHRRSNLNLTKVVTGEDAPADAKFAFDLTVNNSKAPESAPAGDTDHESDYWIWLSIRDENSQGVTGLNMGSGVVEDGGGYYYAPNGTTFSLEIGAGWGLRFLNLPSDTTYTFVEGTLPEGFAFEKSELTQGEDSTFSGDQTTTGTIENTKTSYYVTYTNDYALTDLEITKVWEDNDDQDGIRLTADELKAKLTLSPAVEGKEPTVVDNEDGTYTIKYTGLPRYNDGVEIEYTVAESAIDGYTTEGSPAEDHGTITNTHEPEEIEVSVTKVWNDSDDIGKIRPTSIKMQLYADGEASGDPVTLNSDKWTYTWEHLPKFAEGEKIQYTVDETAVPDGYKEEDPVIETDDDGNVTVSITNTYNPTPVSVDPPVQKVIENNSDLYNQGDFTFTIEAVSPEDAPMPENTSITNSADYELAGKTGFYEFGEIEFTMPGVYEYIVKESGEVDGVTNDPAAEDGKTLTFTVTDDGTGKLTVTPTTDDVQLSFTNTYDADGQATITVSKAVEGAAWPEGKTLTLTLSGKGGTLPETTTATLTSTGSVSFDPIVYQLSDAGKTYTYTISEDGFGAGWTGSGDVTATVVVTDNGDGTLGTSVTYSPENATITNTYEAEGEAVLEATKAIEGAAWPEGKTITFTLSGEGGTLPETKTVTLTAAGKATFGAITYDESDAGKTYTYTISEDGFGAGWTGSGDVTATVVVTDNGDGTLSTEVTYSPEDATITNTYEATGKATLEVTKAITGAAWPSGKTLTLTLSGTGGTLPEIKTKELTTAGKATFGDITYTEADAGKTYTYTITEDGFGAGWTGSGDVTATVVVTDNGDGTLSTNVTYSPTNATITNTYKAEGEAVLEVTKEITGAAWPEDATLTFTLSGEGGTLPETKEQTLTEPGTVTFDAISYDESDAGKTYTYTISEDGFGAGWTGSGDVTATVVVTDNGNGTLSTSVTYSPEDAVITNTYEAEGEAVLEVTKEITGAAWPEGETLTFTLSGEGGTLPEFTTVELTEADTVKFDAITYDESDAGKTYTYTISEDGFGDGWTGSGDVTATVVVTDNGDGTLATEITYSPEDAVITNTYEAEGEAILEISKVLSGAEWPEGATLTFTLSGEGGTLPEETTVELTEAGTVTFGAITYDESDAGQTYTYTISEDGFGEGWSGSGDVTATVVVTDNGDGTLSTEISYSPEDTITNTYVADGKVVLEVTKAVEGASWPEGKTLTLTLSGEGGTLPETKTVTLTAAGKVAFDAIAYDEADAGKTYTYTISEDGFGTGWTGSGSVTATVVVTDNGDGTLTATPTYSPEDATITNTYEATGEAVLEAKKEIEGAAWPEGATLTFTLSGEGGTLPEIKEQTLTEPGTVTFDAITYDESDAGQTYTYTISEDGFGDGWTGSGDITATVEVIDNGDGTLSTNITYSPEDDVITNTYEATGEAVLEVTKEISGAAWPEGKTLTFTLAGEGGVLPETKTAALTAAGKATFGAIVYDEYDAGQTYTYTITEDGFGAGWTGSGDITATVVVTDNGDGTLSTEVTYSPEDATITNTYEATGKATLEVTKAITGAAWPEGKTLTLTLSGTGGTLPATTTVELTAEGAATFEAITYDESDAGKTYTYTISEDGFGAGWTGSGDVTATVVVTDNGDGTLSTEVTYDPEDATVINTYEATGEAVLEVTKKLSGASWPSGRTLTMTLSGEGGTLPESKTVTLTEAGTVAFDAITYNESDAGQTYTYTISENGFGGNWSSSGKVTATVEVTDNGDGTLATAITYAPKDKTITNKYTPPEPREYLFSFTKMWEGGYVNDISWTLYDKNGNVVRKYFDKKKMVEGEEYKYTAYFKNDVDGYYLIENVPEGYTVRYENIGKYAGITDRLCNGGTMINHKVPRTGDSANLALWFGMALAGMTMAGGAVFFSRKKRAQKR